MHEPLASAAELAPGTKLGRYTIDKQLGRGGMGAVYVATHMGTGRSVALKVIASRHAGAADVTERFRREARALGRLQHPNVVDISDFGVEILPSGEVHYLVMELVKGCSLRDELNRQGRMSLATVIDIVEQVARALDAAHEAGIVHRDLKPENVQIVPLGAGRQHVKVLDFGIAKLGDRDDVMVLPSLPTAPSTDPSGFATASEVLTGVSVMGTPPYMAPEQFFAQPIDARCDVYALAVMTWELLSGGVPRTGNVFSIAAQHITRAPLPDMAAHGVARDTKAFIASGLAHDRDDRPATAGQFAARLRVLMAGEAALYEAARGAIPRRLWVETAITFALAMPLLIVLTVVLTAATPFSLSGRMSWSLFPLGMMAMGHWLAGGVVAMRSAPHRRLLDLLAGPALGTLRANGVPLAKVASLAAPLVLRWLSAVGLSLLGVLTALFVFAAALDLVEVVDPGASDASALNAPIAVLLGGLVVSVWASVVMTARQVATARLIVAGHRGNPVAVGVGSRLGGVGRRSVPLALALLGLIAFSFARQPLLRLAVSIPMDLSTTLLLLAGADVRPRDAFDPLGQRIKHRDAGLGDTFAIGVLLDARAADHVDEAATVARAIEAGNLGALQRLFHKASPGEQSVTISSMDLHNARGHTGLSLVADVADAGMRAKMAALLLQAGANPDAPNSDGSTARGRLQALGDPGLAALLTRY